MQHNKSSAASINLCSIYQRIIHQIFTFRSILKQRFVKCSNFWMISVSTIKRSFAYDVCEDPPGHIRAYISRKVKSVDRFFEGALTAPIANLLIVAGLIFLGIAAIGKISGKIEPDTTGRVVAGVIGICVLCLGLGIHLFPDNFDSSRRLQPTEALQPSTLLALATSVPVRSATTLIVLAPTSTSEAEQPTVPAATVPMIVPTPCPVPATSNPTLASAPEATDLPFLCCAKWQKKIFKPSLAMNWI
jgi:hypothetical protein